MSNDMEKHEREINFNDEGSYLVTNQEIQLIPNERFAEFGMQLHAQAADYSMDLDFKMTDEGILISWKPVG